MPKNGTLLTIMFSRRDIINSAFSELKPPSSVLISSERTGKKIKYDIPHTVSNSKKILTVAAVRLIPRDSRKLAKGSKTYANNAAMITNFTISEIATRNSMNSEATIKRSTILINVFVLFDTGTQEVIHCPSSESTIPLSVHLCFSNVHQ